MIERINPNCDLEVDGGIDSTTGWQAVEAGANLLVAGTVVFGDREGVTAGMKGLTGSLDLVNQ